MDGEAVALAVAHGVNVAAVDDDAAPRSAHCCR
jgi:hypothetical protein